MSNLSRRAFLRFLLTVPIVGPVAMKALAVALAAVVNTIFQGQLGEYAGARFNHRQGPGDVLAERARFWFLEAQQHPLWKKYRNERKEDMGFYSGGKAQSSIRLA